MITYLPSGIADIVGRRFGSQKLPYNKNKSFAGSIAMVVAGFISSVACVSAIALILCLANCQGF